MERESERGRKRKVHKESKRIFHFKTQPDAKKEHMQQKATRNCIEVGRLISVFSFFSWY